MPAALNGHGHAAAEVADDLARGDVPGIRRIRREMHLGRPEAQQVREYLERARRLQRPRLTTITGDDSVMSTVKIQITMVI